MRVNEEANMKDRGIYLIINNESGAVYIGATSKSFDERLDSHLSQLRNNKHSNPHLQSAWNKYGEDIFEFTILEYIDDVELLNTREKYWIDYHRMFTDIYNIELDPNKFGGHSLRVYGKRSKESIQKQKNTIKKYWSTPRLKRREQLRAMRRGEKWVRCGRQSPFYEHGFSLGDQIAYSYWEAIEIEYQRWMDGDLTY